MTSFFASSTLHLPPSFILSILCCNPHFVNFFAFSLSLRCIKMDSLVSNLEEATLKVSIC